MMRYVGLLQGINVGKHRRIAMSDLKAMVENLGHTDVKTHLNSGNVVFTAAVSSNDDLAREIEAAITSHLGIDVPVVVRSRDEMRRIVGNNPFPAAAADHTTLHVTFLGGVLDPVAVASLAEREKGDDDCRVAGADVYLYYPNKITGAVFTLHGLNVVATSRNWRTVTRLAEMVGE